MVSIPRSIVDDLCSRFLLNLPEAEKRDPIRVCFQAELAHWFYLDFYSGSEKGCNYCGLREFIRLIFHHCGFLAEYREQVDRVVDEWRKYKANVPTYGAILVDEPMEHVLLVQGFYAKNSWGFPKGKVNEDEEEINCAIREVEEETGFPIPRGQIHRKQFLEQRLGDSPVRLYLVSGVSVQFQFEPQTRKEIRKIQWFRIGDLPTSKTDSTNAALGIYPNHFFTVIPFLEDLKRWIQKRRERQMAPHSAFSPVSARKWASQSTLNNVPNLPPRLIKQRLAREALVAPTDRPVYEALQAIPQPQTLIFPAKAWSQFHFDVDAILSNFRL